MLILTLFVITSCDDSSTGPTTELPDLSSIYVLNEGNFSDSNGTITSVDVEAQSVTNQAFEKVNNRPLAGLVQSASIFNDKLYISLNRANKIEIADPQSLESIATIPLTTNITDLEVLDGNTAYATNLYNSVSVDSVSIIDLASGEETKQRIPVGDQPRDILKVGSLVYVANTGFSGSGKTVSVIDTQTNTVIKSIDVGVAPVQLVLDNANQVWVVCSGLVPYDDTTQEIPGSIYILDGESASVVEQIDVNGHPSALVLDEKNNRGFLLDGGVKVIDLNTKQITDTLIEMQNATAIFYSSKEERIYLGKRPQVGPYSQPGKVVRYNLQGAAIDSFGVGISPTGFISTNNN